ncbi:uncharacterized protein EDB93DRAFT_1108991 [Suillus bovinus]|uniref:uncharacterized protein n=1 Tax=Suillus bovinus TaxID=48563 RepID=UPI001B85BDA9|nr:uncharacterized protein EDB93DRAFT_1108991 [Suillus bovinus]KAG2128540.1 hypothetical protein EDB93DRAFT_1108991 [Suillus bovinus]
MYTWLNYYKHMIFEFGEPNRAIPMCIIFFRDGLSEGYALVGQEEIEDITEAINDVWWDKGVKGAKPELTFIVVDDDEATLFLSSSSAQMQFSGGDFSTPLCPVSSTTCTPLNISAPKPDPSSGIAFHHLAPLSAPHFIPQPKSKTDTDTFLKKQADTMKRLCIWDFVDSDEDWGIIEDQDSDGEPVQRLPMCHRKVAQGMKSLKLSFQEGILLSVGHVQGPFPLNSSRV